MTNKEKVTRNIGLAFDFFGDLIDHPEKIELLPDEAVIEFVEKDFPKIEKKRPETFNEPVKKYIKVKNTFEI